MKVPLLTRTVEHMKLPAVLRVDLLFQNPLYDRLRYESVFDINKLQTFCTIYVHIRWKNKLRKAAFCLLKYQLEPQFCEKLMLFSKIISEVLFFYE